MVRGGHDDNSDVDVLVVVEDGFGTVPTEAVEKFLSSLICGDPSISWYAKKRVAAMFDSGDLFAWHLFRESKGLGDYQDISRLLGPPRRYQTATSDIEELHEILRGVAEAVTVAPHNAIFELGILYVCARNIAMSASWHLCDVPNFKRYSPLELPILFPLTVDEYELIMVCRMASQRGTRPPDRASSVSILGLQERLMAWSTQVLGEVGKIV